LWLSHDLVVLGGDCIISLLRNTEPRHVFTLKGARHLYSPSSFILPSRTQASLRDVSIVRKFNGRPEQPSRCLSLHCCSTNEISSRVAASIWELIVLEILDTTSCYILDTLLDSNHSKYTASYENVCEWEKAVVFLVSAKRVEEATTVAKCCHRGLE
jgi:hypothetical protein